MMVNGNLTLGKAEKVINFGGFTVNLPLRTCALGGGGEDHQQDMNKI